jgi:hypothetical protein
MPQTGHLSFAAGFSGFGPAAKAAAEKKIANASAAKSNITILRELFRRNISFSPRHIVR